MNKKIIAAIVALSATTVSHNALATNGDKMLGITATQWGMAGAYTAAPQDAATVLTNPAGLADLEMEEFRADFGFGFLNPPRSVNGQSSDSDLYLIPAGALAYRVNEKLTFGMGMGGISGMGVDFADAYPSMPGNQSIVTTKQLFKLAPGFGYKVNDKLSLGATFNLNYQSLAISNPMFQLPQTQVYGFGGVFGATYHHNDKVTLGLSYETQQRMQEFEWNTTAGRYSMTLDSPPVLSFGVAFKPADGLLIEADIKQIWFSDVIDSVDFSTPGGTMPMAFGWDDQTVFAIGVQKALNPKTTLRFGYNYGASPIGPEDVDNNIGSLAITEHHLSVGMSRELTNRLSGSFSYARAFGNEVTSNSGSGNTIELDQNIFNFQMTYRY